MDTAVDTRDRQKAGTGRDMRPRKESPGSRPRRAGRTGEALHFLVFAVPAAVIYIGLVLVPMVMAIGTSTTDSNQFRPVTSFIGLRNYLNLFQDPAYLQVLRNTVILTLIVTVVPNVVGLGIALLLDHRGWVFNVMRAVFFIPVVLSSVVVGVIWEAVLTNDGLLNQILRGLGVAHPPGWLSDPGIALYSIASIICWQSLGVCVVIYLAGLQGIPRELVEAATIDGAGAVQQFRAVTWPLLAPAVTITTVLLLIGGFKTYDQVKVMTNGGPGVGTTYTLAFDVVETGVNGPHVGYGAAKATVMLVLIALVSTLVLRVLQRRELER